MIFDDVAGHLLTEEETCLKRAFDVFVRNEKEKEEDEDEEGLKKNFIDVGVVPPQQHPPHLDK